MTPPEESKPVPRFGEAPRVFVRPVSPRGEPYTAPRLNAAMANLRELNPEISAERAELMVSEITRRMVNTAEDEVEPTEEQAS